MTTTTALTILSSLKNNDDYNPVVLTHASGNLAVLMMALTTLRIAISARPLDHDNNYLMNKLYF
jgi:hypothetical protein